MKNANGTFCKLHFVLIYSDLDKDGKQYYQVYDVFFRRWIQNK